MDPGPGGSHLQTLDWRIVGGRQGVPSSTLGTYQIRRGAQRSPGGTGRGWYCPRDICHHFGTHSHQGFLPWREEGASDVGVLEGGALS